MVPYPVFMTPQKGLPFAPWRTCLIEQHLDLHEKIQPSFHYYAKIITTQSSTDYSHVFIQLIEVEQRSSEPRSNTAVRDSNPSPLR